MMACFIEGLVDGMQEALRRSDRDWCDRMFIRINHALRDRQEEIAKLEALANESRKRYEALFDKQEP
jgi:hypothetical protein